MVAWVSLSVKGGYGIRFDIRGDTMTPVEWACVAAGMLFLAKYTSDHRDKLTCDYCGVYRGHDAHCPYNDVYPNG